MTSCWSGSASASAWPRSSAAGCTGASAGAAGEIGYLPVPGVPLPEDVTHPATGAFQRLVGAQACCRSAAQYGFAEPTRPPRWPLPSRRGSGQAGMAAASS